MAIYTALTKALNSFTYYFINFFTFASLLYKKVGLFKPGGVMGYFAQFKIPFVGLSLGSHRFDYLIDHKFFEHFENAVIKKGNLTITLNLLKQETMLILDFDISGELDVVCDRCAGGFSLPVQGSSNLIIKLGDEAKELNENMVMINRHDHDINVGHYIYEFVSLLLPQRIIHPEDANGKSGCDKKTIQAIRQLSSRSHEADPRWEVLKKLNIKE